MIAQNLEMTVFCHRVEIDRLGAAAVRRAATGAGHFDKPRFFARRVISLQSEIVISHAPGTRASRIADGPVIAPLRTSDAPAARLGRSAPLHNAHARSPLGATAIWASELQA